MVVLAAPKSTPMLYARSREWTNSGCESRRRPASIVSICLVCVFATEALQIMPQESSLFANIGASTPFY
jgi:hypothetical protein